MGNYLDGDYRALKSIISVALFYLLFAELTTHISFVAYSPQLLSLDDGFALAVMLALTRSRALLGLVLGAALLSVYRISELDSADLSTQFSFLVIPFFIILIQAYINLKIYRKWISLDNNLSHNNDLFHFLMIIPIIAAVNTLFSLLSYQWLAPTAQEIFISVWLKIWIGHTASLLLVIPVVLSIVEKNNSLWNSRKKILVFNFTAFVSIIFLVCSNISKHENSKSEERFKILTSQAVTLFQFSLKEKELLQSSVAQLIVSSEDVTRAEFKQFVNGLSQQNNYIQIVKWLPKIKHEQRANYQEL